MFPIHRPRRLRSSDAIRDMVRETHVRAEDLIYPMFVQETSGVVEPIESMPGQERHTIDSLLAEIGCRPEDHGDDFFQPVLALQRVKHLGEQAGQRVWHAKRTLVSLEYLGIDLQLDQGCAIPMLQAAHDIDDQWTRFRRLE